MGNFGVGEWLVVLLVILVLFGAKKIPDLAKGIGKGIRDFKKELKDDDEDKTSDKDKK
jgi:sec-independent protein translocase protein TatA